VIRLQGGRAPGADPTPADAGKVVTGAEKQRAQIFACEHRSMRHRRPVDPPAPAPGPLPLKEALASPPPAPAVEAPEWVLPASLPKRATFTVAIASYNRAECLGRLLDDLEKEASESWVRMHVVVVDDASTEDYSGIARRLKRKRWTYIRHDTNHGRDRYADLVRDLHGRLREMERTDYYCTLADDFRLCDGFLARCVTLWEGIRDEKKIAMVPYVDKGRDTAPCWTGIAAIHGQVIDRIGWVDCACFSTAAYYEAMNWSLGQVKLLPPSLRTGSGVGQACSRSALDAGGTIYRPHRSLVVHAAVRSVMHSLAAPRLVTSDFVRYVDGAVEYRRRLYSDRVTGHVCSIPSRREALRECVAAFLPQVDRLVVVLNGYEDVPEYLSDPRIEVVRSQDVGDLGSCGKFWRTEEPGYHVTIDDDLLAADDYVLTLLHWVEHWRRQAVVSFHGSILLDPIVSYYHSRAVLRCLADLEAGDWVHVPGTGVCAWHSDTLPLATGELIPAGGLRERNMSDITLALLLQARGIPAWTAPHAAGMVKQQKVGAGIYSASKARDGSGMDSGAMQTDIVKRGQWHRFVVDPRGGVAA